MEIGDQERRGYLKDEYLLLQEQYEDFDRRSLQIKGWLAAGAAAALAVGIDSESRAAAAIPVATAVITLAVWYLEARWKMFQYALTDRIRLIEAYFRGDEDMPEREPAPFQVYQYWYLTYVKDKPLYPYETHRPMPFKKRLRIAAMQRFVSTLYLTILGLCVASFVAILLFPTAS